MKKRKSIELDDQKKHLLIYLSLLAAAIFIAIQNPEGLWLPIGLTVGIVIDQFSIIKRKKTDAKSVVVEAESVKEDIETPDK